MTIIFKKLKFCDFTIFLSEDEIKEKQSVIFVKNLNFTTVEERFREVQFVLFFFKKNLKSFSKQ